MRSSSWCYTNHAYTLKPDLDFIGFTLIHMCCVTPDFVEPKSGAHHMCDRINFHTYDLTSSVINQKQCTKKSNLILLHGQQSLITSKASYYREKAKHQCPPQEGRRQHTRLTPGNILRMPIPSFIFWAAFNFIWGIARVSTCCTQHVQVGKFDMQGLKQG